MNLRKGFLAAATATAVTLSGVVAPVNAETAPAQPTKSAEQIAAEAELLKQQNERDRIALEKQKLEDQRARDAKAAKEKEDRENATTGEKIQRQFVEGSTDSNGNIDPKAVTAWIAVFTGVVGAIGTLITFLEKNFNIKFY